MEENRQRAFYSTRKPKNRAPPGTLVGDLPSLDVSSLGAASGAALASEKTVDPFSLEMPSALLPSGHTSASLEDLVLAVLGTGGSKLGEVVEEIIHLQPRELQPGPSLRFINLPVRVFRS